MTKKDIQFIKDNMNLPINQIIEYLEQPKITKYKDRIEYRVHGKRHRTDGPAVEWVDGSKEWYVDGKRHRTDGPAIEYANGTKYWYVDGNFIVQMDLRLNG